MNQNTISTTIAFLILTMASVHDIRKREISEWMMGAAVVTSLCSCILKEQADPVRQAAIAVVPGLLLLAVAVLCRDSVGFGDGILAACIGPCFGITRMATGMFFALLIGAIVSIFLIALRKAGRKTTLPFVPLLTLGMGVTQLVC